MPIKKKSNFEDKKYTLDSKMQELISTSPIVTISNRHQAVSTPVNDQENQDNQSQSIKSELIGLYSTSNTTENNASNSAVAAVAAAAMAFHYHQQNYNFSVNNLSQSSSSSSASSSSVSSSTEGSPCGANIHINENISGSFNDPTQIRSNMLNLRCPVSSTLISRQLSPNYNQIEPSHSYESNNEFINQNNIHQPSSSYCKFQNSIFGTISNGLQSNEHLSSSHNHHIHHLQPKSSNLFQTISATSATFKPYQAQQQFPTQIGTNFVDNYQIRHIPAYYTNEVSSSNFIYNNNNNKIPTRNDSSFIKIESDESDEKKNQHISISSSASSLSPKVEAINGLTSILPMNQYHQLSSSSISSSSSSFTSSPTTNSSNAKNLSSPKLEFNENQTNATTNQLMSNQPQRNINAANTLGPFNNNGNNGHQAKAEDSYDWMKPTKSQTNCN